jgi:hypothetical protein
LTVALGLRDVLFDIDTACCMNLFGTEMSSNAFRGCSAYIYVDQPCVSWNYKCRVIVPANFKLGLAQMYGTWGDEILLTAIYVDFFSKHRSNFKRGNVLEMR